jgi:hypothetical protein
MALCGDIEIHSLKDKGYFALGLLEHLCSSNMAVCIVAFGVTTPGWFQPVYTTNGIFAVLGQVVPTGFFTVPAYRQFHCSRTGVSVATGVFIVPGQAFPLLLYRRYHWTGVFVASVQALPLGTLQVFPPHYYMVAS